MDQNIHTGEQKKQNMLRKAFGKFSAVKFSLVMALMSLLSLSAFAADGETTSGFDSVMSSMDTLGTLMGKVWTLMTSNALLTLFLAVSLLSVGVSVFAMIKRAAHR